MKRAIVNDITQLNPVPVRGVVRPRSIAELQAAVRAHAGPVSIAGGRFSMGGQIAADNALLIDMTGLDAVTAYDPARKEITVQAGASWRAVQERVDPDNLSVSIMQSFANFTVGGSLGVNCHGRYVGAGPLILSVKSIRLVTAAGDLVNASPSENADLFYGAIGGYGGLGVIADATLTLADNVVMARDITRVPLSGYKDYFDRHIANNPGAVFHNADFYPPDYDSVTAVTFAKTDRPLTVPDRLRPKQKNYISEYLSLWALTQVPGLKRLREKFDDAMRLNGEEVVTRNYEAGHHVEELEPSTRAMTTYALQEYFVPVDRFDEFAPKMVAILQKHDVNAVNVSIRHARRDPGSLLAWAGQGDVFAFVLYHKQWTHEKARQDVGVWTRELIDAALSCGGSYYLPYQLHATQEQFARAYPRADEFFALKRRVDPDNKFRNRLWDKYDPAGPQIDPETPAFRAQSRAYWLVPKIF